jgi:hypothetical protein
MIIDAAYMIEHSHAERANVLQMYLSWLYKYNPSNSDAKRMAHVLMKTCIHIMSTSINVSLDKL